MNDADAEADFEKADIILADALQRFQADAVSPYVYGMALMEIGIAALVKAGEDAKPRSPGSPARSQAGWPS